MFEIRVLGLKPHVPHSTNRSTPDVNGMNVMKQLNFIISYGGKISRGSIFEIIG